MSLVAYDSSGSESDKEEERESCIAEKVPGPVHVEKGVEEANAKGIESRSNPHPGTSLFSLLPAPKRPIGVSVVLDDPLPIKVPRKETVKIRIPSLKEFQEDEEEEEEKSKLKRKPSKAGSGLMGLLPEPQNGTAKSTPKLLIPHSVTRKPTTPKPLPKPPVVPPMNRSQDGPTSDEEPVTDFFSLTNSPGKDPPLPENDYSTKLPFPESPKTVTNPAHDYPSYTTREFLNPGGPSFASNDASSSNWTSDGSIETSQYENYTTVDSRLPQWDNQVPAQSPALQSDALLRLAGKKQSIQENIDLVDVNADDLTAGRNEWLLKSLSEVHSYQSAPKRSDQPSAMHRRKHQITYLAFQAKAREQELKNQWANNRMTKKQTQSKYGF